MGQWCIIVNQVRSPSGLNPGNIGWGYHGWQNINLGFVGKGKNDNNSM